MPKASKRASAHKFIVISAAPRATTYTGTREQLISSGIAKPDQFPEGRKRLKWDYSKFPDTWEVRKLKGGIFSINKGHEHQYAAPKKPPEFTLKVSPEENDWTLGGSGLDEFSYDSSYRAIYQAAELIVNAVKREQYQAKRSHLQLVRQITATGGK